MKNNCDLNFTIIGMGYLMEYIYPCYQSFLGDNLKKNIIAVTADEGDLQRKQEKFGFKIILNNNLDALMENEPDIVLFAPPPKIAPILIKDVIVPYYNYLRENNRPLPELYAFPPNPTGKYYLEQLGDDILVANILPNMVSEIAGEKLEGEGLTYVTYPKEGPWPQESVQRLKDFFSPLGSCIEVKPEHVMQMLAGTVTVHNISEIIFTITDALNSKNMNISFQNAAGAMRAYHHEKRNYYPNNSYPCSKDQVEPLLYEMLKKVTYHWFEGIKRFYLDAKMNEKTADTILISLLDLHLHLHQREKRYTIEENTKQHATKGGVLEKGCIKFAELLQQPLFKKFTEYPQISISDQWCSWLENRAYDITKIVSEHGKKLSSTKKSEPFQIDNHALMFALIVKHALSIGGDCAEQALVKATKRYAYERGNRMRQRCLANGDYPTMLNYMAYGEWRPQQGTMEIVTLEKSPVNKTKVTLCPWCESWKANGVFEYAKYYCDYVDFSLVKGFNSDLNLEMSQFLARGDDCCKFIWNGANLTPENEEKLLAKKRELGDISLMSWEYHTSHLYYSMIDEIKKWIPENAAKEISKAVKADFAAEFGEECLEVLDGFISTDFTIAQYNKKTDNE